MHVLLPVSRNQRIKVSMALSLWLEICHAYAGNISALQ